MKYSILLLAAWVPIMFAIGMGCEEEITSPPPVMQKSDSLMVAWIDWDGVFGGAKLCKNEFVIYMRHYKTDERISETIARFQWPGKEWNMKMYFSHETETFQEWSTGVLNYKQLENYGATYWYKYYVISTILPECYPNCNPFRRSTHIKEDHQHFVSCEGGEMLPGGF